MSTAISEGALGELARTVGGRLLRVRAPLPGCRPGAHAPDCAEALACLRDPFAIEEDPGAFQTTGWHRAYEARPSSFAVAAESAADIAAAVSFGRDHDLRLAVKGTGHDYLGRSSAPASLLVWTHRMRDITVHDSFMPTGQPSGTRGVPAVTVGAGTRWLEVYQALGARGRFVLGGGCTSVGAAGGFTRGGGFGPFSRRYGTAAGNVLEAEVVTASGEIPTVNAGQHPDLFWALRGGGGTFGVVSKLTMRTYPMPAGVAIVAGTIRASTDEGFRRLVGALIRFAPDLCDDRWGEQIRFRTDNTVQVFMVAAGLDGDEAREVWQPFLAQADADDALIMNVSVHALPGSALWDPSAPDQIAAGLIRRRDNRPGQPPGRFWWAANSEEVAQYLHAYQSRWLPGRLLHEFPDELSDALVAATRQCPVSLHLNIGLQEAAPEAMARDRATAIHPAAFEAAGLVIVASAQRCAIPGVPGHEPDEALAAAGASGQQSHGADPEADTGLRQRPERDRLLRAAVAAQPLGRQLPQAARDQAGLRSSQRVSRPPRDRQRRTCVSQED